MRIYTVTCNGRPLAVVRAEDPGEAVAVAQDLAREAGARGSFAAREPQDAEMVSWLENRADHLLEDKLAAVP